MGQEQSAVTIQEADSVCFPGRKCFVTSSLDELGDYDRLWEELPVALRTDFAKDPLVKSGEVMERSVNQFDVVKIFDREKMKIGTGELSMRMKLFLDKERGEIREEQRDIGMDRLEEVRYFRTLKDPLRLELFAQRIDNKHRYGPLPQASLKNILKRVCKQDEVVIFPGRPSRTCALSPDPRFLIVESQALDELISFDDLVTGIIDSLKTREYEDLVKSGTVSVKELSKDASKEVFEVRYMVSGEKLAFMKLQADTTDRAWKTQVEHGHPTDPSSTDGAKDEAPVHFFVSFAIDEATGALLDTSFMVVFRGPPLVVEAWNQTALPVDMQVSPAVDPGHHFFRAGTARALQGWANLLVERMAK